MIILHNRNDTGSEGRVVLLFGTGLLGSSILQHLQLHDDYRQEFFPFNWYKPEKNNVETNTILTYLNEIIGRHEVENSSSFHAAFIWCAGKAGFSATKENHRQELTSYTTILALAKNLQASHRNVITHFHLISSAGGLFEGQRVIDLHSSPQPKRIYGFLKHEQENNLLLQGDGLIKYIYRPTSVYGYRGPGQRMGLITSLISNGIKNRVTNIYGDLSTLRDYVFNDDIAAFICCNLFKNRNLQGASSYLLGSGKPSSIHEIKHFVEMAIGKKIYLKFSNNDILNNRSDITIATSAFPELWSPTSLQTGLRYVKAKIMAH